MSHDWTWLIGRTSGLVFVSGVCVLLLVRWRPLTNPAWHRLAWSVVLLQGLMLFPGSWTVHFDTAWVNWPGVDWPPLSMPARLPPEVVGQSRSGRSLLAQNQGSVDRDSAEPALPPPIAAVLTQEPAIGLVERRAHPAVASDVEVAIQSAGRLPISQSAAKAGRDEPSAGGFAPGHSAVVPPDDFHHWGARGNTTKSMRRVSSDRWSAGSVVNAASLVWLGGFVAVLGALVRNYVRLAFALRRCRPARPQWSREFQALCVELNIRERVSLHVHSTLGPFIAWTPRGHRIVVPVRLWNRLSTSERIAVLHHELSHLRRGDLWKSLLARCVVAVHWFNPMAWLAARRFDETAEWACDALMARESPGRVTRLATAILAAAGSCENRPLPALAATGGPLFQRVRRLLNVNTRGDSIMHKCLWTGLLCAVALCGIVQLRFIEPSVLEAADGDAGPDAESETADLAKSIATNDRDRGSPGALRELGDRIVVNDSELLRKFVDLVAAPTGQIVMADRAAVRAQNATQEVDLSTHWEQFVSKHFERTGDQWRVKSDARDAIADYLRSVEAARADLLAIAPVLHEVAEQLVSQSEQTPMLRRYLQHEAAPAVIYEQELRGRLHPGADDIADRLGQHLVRTQSGRYVIRPGRRAQVERRLNFIDKLQPALLRFQRELAAWGAEFIDSDDLHRQFAAVLADPLYAQYSVFQLIGEETRPTDEALEGAFWRLEEATDDIPEGLKLNPDHDQCRELQQDIARFTAIARQREYLQVPLIELAERLEPLDELHERLKGFLQSDLAVMFLAREMDYLPVPADQAAREFLASIATRNEAGGYEITSASPEELQNRIDEFFRESREQRRRGRVIDEFALQVADEATQEALTSAIGKLLLKPLIARSIERPEVDGLQLWFDDFFEETPEGLVLRDGADPAIEEVLQEAAEIEAQLSRTDF